MAFDGITIAALTHELSEALTGGRVNKIAQPEADEILMTVKSITGSFRLLLSADASLPLIYLTEQNKQSPMTAPGFCMLLRKHLQNSKIISISQPGLERVLCMEFEHFDEMGDLCTKKLYIEIMGKHSNIIFCNENDVIIDSIKHVSGLVSSVREVLPGREYFIPKTQEKVDPVLEYFKVFKAQDETAKNDAVQDYVNHIDWIKDIPQPIYKAIYSKFTGISPIMAQEVCSLAGLDADLPPSAFNDSELCKLDRAFLGVITKVVNHDFAPEMIYEGKTPLEYSALPLTIYNDAVKSSHSSMSELLETYYAEKEVYTRIRQRSADLRRIVQTALERNVKKYDLQLKQMKDTEKRDKYRIYGELLNTYGYNLNPGDKFLETVNYYDGTTVKIPLDETKTPQENAQKYFEKYNKQKRTYEALSELTISVKEEIDHLETVLASLDIALREDDLIQIKDELIESGYIKKKGQSKKIKITSKPFHYLSSDGFDIYVGKNNLQNDELTFKFANGGDWWFHAKKIPGSHVVVKTEGKELPDRTFEEAARLAAFYSKGRDQEKVEIDYVLRKEVKKPAGSKPGFVVYYTNYSMAIDSDISIIKLISD